MQEGRQPKIPKGQDHAAHPGTDKTVLYVVMTSTGCQGQGDKARDSSKILGQAKGQEPRGSAHLRSQHVEEGWAGFVVGGRRPEGP